MGKSRQRRKVTKERYLKFEAQTAKQLREDLAYAIEKKYIDSIHVEAVSGKIEEVISWLRPKQKTIIHRGIRKLNKIISRWLNQLDVKLP